MTPRLAPSAGPRDLHALKRAICARARDFDIAPLLDLLTTMGYRPGDVWFRGHLGEAPQPTLLHHIAFDDLDGDDQAGDDEVTRTLDLGSVADLAGDAPLSPRARPPLRHRATGPAPQVTITVNLGLLSCRSPLPSYFQQLLRDGALHEPLVELLRLLDRHLLRTRLFCDRADRVVERWDDVTGDLVRIQSLDSLVGLSWLFRHVFPELPVRVERTAEQLRVPYASARLGLSELGSACLGALTRIDVHDFQVTLRCEESLLRPGVPWLHEVDRRLRTVVFPALDPVCMNLTIVLELEDDHAVAMLRDDAAHRESYLGVDPLGGLPAPAAPGEPGHAPPSRAGARGSLARTIVLYRGLLPRDRLDTAELEAALAAQARVTVAPRVAHAGAQRDARCELELALHLGDRAIRYQAIVRWGVRAWSRDEPCAIELRHDHVRQAAPTARHHPQLWSLLRDRARRALAG